MDMAELAGLKKGAIDHEGDFIDYCKPLGIWADRLRKVIFPNGGRGKRENPRLFSRKQCFERPLGGRIIDKVTIDV